MSDRPLDILRAWLTDACLDGLIIPSTDQYLSEFSPPESRYLTWVTGFSGSTGYAVVTGERAALFVDSRYSEQALRESGDAGFDVRPAHALADWAAENIERGASLGANAWLHSVNDLTRLTAIFAGLGQRLIELDQWPIDALWNDRPLPHPRKAFDYASEFSGQEYAVKRQQLTTHLTSIMASALVVADPEDVAWLLNIRCSIARSVSITDWQVVPSCPSRLILEHDGTMTWFVDEQLIDEDLRAARADVGVLSPREFRTKLLALAGRGVVAMDLSRTPAAVTRILGRDVPLRDNDIVAVRRWTKDSREAAAARRAHRVDARAVIRFMAWLKRKLCNQDVSEMEAARALEEFRREDARYLGASMPYMSAAGASSGQPHYVPTPRSDRSISAHPIYWMDSGGQYLGGSTDNTITIATSKPEARHIAAHTAVVKAFLSLATCRFPEGTTGHQLDAVARQSMWRSGFDYGHGTGHGVGNMLNIHEGPYLSKHLSRLSMIPLKEHMIVTNEPGYYAAGHFGVRIESHMVVRPSDLSGFLEFDTISRLPIDPDLIDFDSLTAEERAWLASYHDILQSDIGPGLDTDDQLWLAALVARYHG